MGVILDPSLMLVPQVKEQTAEGQHEIRRLLFLRLSPERKPDHGAWLWSPALHKFGFVFSHLPCDTQ